MPQARPRILVVEDEPDVAELLTLFLSDEYDVTVLDDFSDVVGAVRGASPDLVLMDWNLPGRPGIDWCAEIKADPDFEDVPLLFLTGRSSVRDETEGLEAGAADYIRKPVAPKLLKTRIRNHLLVRQHLLNERRKTALEAVERQRLADCRNAIMQLLRTGSQPLTLKQQLIEALRVISGIPWLEAEFKGAIFLADTDGTLFLVAERGVEDSIREQCARVSPGVCLCGRAAARRELVFSCHDDVLRSRDKERSHDHAHYCIPLQEGDRLLGVLTVYVRPGHRPVESETILIGEIAATLSGLISRRLMESILKVNEFEVQESQNHVIRVLSSAAEYRDNETGMHVLRMAQVARRIGEAVGLDESDLEMLFRAAPMHDVGKIGIPDHILLKPGRYTDEEFAVMKTHPVIGERILAGDQPLMLTARSIAGSHHEWWDGNGYPRGLKGEAIPLFGRICALSDVFDALGSERPYKRAWNDEEIVDFIKAASGSQFDPQVVDAFLRVLPEILRLKVRYSDGGTDPHSWTSLYPVDVGTDWKIPWREEYVIGVDVVDEHHRYLIELMNTLLNAIEKDGDVLDVAQAFKALESYAIVHFGEEERLMMRTGYPGLKDHARLHAEFVVQVARMRMMLRSNPLLPGRHVLEFLKTWLVDHILGVDAKMAAFVKADGAEKRRQAF